MKKNTNWRFFNFEWNDWHCYSAGGLYLKSRNELDNTTGQIDLYHA